MGGKRRSLHVDGVQHGAPIPMGALVGNVLFSSGIMGIDPATGIGDWQCRQLAFGLGLSGAAFKGACKMFKGLYKTYLSSDASIGGGGNDPDGVRHRLTSIATMRCRSQSYRWRVGGSMRGEVRGRAWLLPSSAPAP